MFIELCLKLRSVGLYRLDLDKMRSLRFRVKVGDPVTKKP